MEKVAGPVIFGVDDYNYVMILPCQFAIHLWKAEFLYTCTLPCGLCLRVTDRNRTAAAAAFSSLASDAAFSHKVPNKASSFWQCVSVCSDFLISQHFCSSKVNKQSVRSAVLLWQTSMFHVRRIGHNWIKINLNSEARSDNVQHSSRHDPSFGLQLRG